MRRRGNGSKAEGSRTWTRPTPMFVVGAVAVLFGSLLLTAPAAKRFFTDRLTSHISFEQGPTLRQRDGVSQKPKPAVTTIFDGEVYRTEGRLREASAVAIAATLSGVASLTERRPVRNVGELLQDIARRGLLPPGLELAPGRNLLTSEHSEVHVRLRPEPFAVEVLSFGRERLDGPARYFFSLKLEDVKVPDPFANPSAVLACGWQTDTIRPATPEGANENRLAAWASEQQSK